MAVSAKRLIPGCMGARFLLPGAPCLVPCLRIETCQDQPRSHHSVRKHGLKVETNSNGILEEAELFVFAESKDSRQLVIKTDDGKVVYVRPKAFQLEMGTIQ